MNANEDLRREMEAHLNNQQATNMGDATDAVVVSSDEEDEDTLLEAMTSAVNPQYLGDDGTQTGTPSSSLPVGNALNEPGFDEAMTEWFNRGI